MMFAAFGDIGLNLRAKVHRNNYGYIWQISSFKVVPGGHR